MSSVLSGRLARKGIPCGEMRNESRGLSPRTHFLKSSGCWRASFKALVSSDDLVVRLLTKVWRKAVTSLALSSNIGRNCLLRLAETRLMEYERISKVLWACSDLSQFHFLCFGYVSIQSPRPRSVVSVIHIPFALPKRPWIADGMDCKPRTSRIFLIRLGEILPTPSFITSPSGERMSWDFSYICDSSNTTVGFVLLKPEVGPLAEHHGT